MDPQRLESPTVADVINYLKTQPQDAPFRIKDPDTNWMINIIHAYTQDGVVWFTGTYSEMDSSKIAPWRGP